MEDSDRVRATCYLPLPLDGLPAIDTGQTEASAFINATTSFYPGGANFACCDGSVSYVRDRTSTWALDSNGLPLGARRDATGLWTTTPGLFKPDVYRALGSINGGEVISADAY